MTLSQQLSIVYFYDFFIYSWISLKTVGFPYFFSKLLRISPPFLIFIILYFSGEKQKTAESNSEAEGQRRPGILRIIFIFLALPDAL